MTRKTMDVQGERTGTNRRVYIRPSAGGFLDLMIGAVQAFATDNVGQGWLPCDGQEINRQQYQKLFEKIGTSFGTPSNGNVFKLPAINNNNYFIRGGASGQIGRKQLASLHAIDGNDRTDVHSMGITYPNQVTQGYPRATTLKDFINQEEFGDNVYTDQENMYNIYRSTFVHLWSYGRIQGGLVDKVNLNNYGMHTILGSRPKNITLRYYIFAGV